MRRSIQVPHVDQKLNSFVWKIFSALLFWCQLKWNFLPFLCLCMRYHAMRLDQTKNHASLSQLDHIREPIKIYVTNGVERIFIFFFNGQSERQHKRVGKKVFVVTNDILFVHISTVRFNLLKSNKELNYFFFISICLFLLFDLRSLNHPTAFKSKYYYRSIFMIYSLFH